MKNLNDVCSKYQTAGIEMCEVLFSSHVVAYCEQEKVRSQAPPWYNNNKKTWMKLSLSFVDFLLQQKNARKR